MEKITIKTATLFTGNFCTGNCATLDFQQKGYIDITFFVYPHKIVAVDYCGISFNGLTDMYFSCNTAKQAKAKQILINRLILPLEASEAKSKLMRLLNIN